ncbi:MAG: radical SAM protein [Treponema sp. CETP13]|nr:MAG: radical SAM protein [Treponema sp. CETP13]
MSNNTHVFGPVPSRRLGLSLGVSPIPEKTCNYSCTYCQLGRTNCMTNKRELFYPVKEIADQVKKALEKNKAIDVVSIVGEGEPTLYAGLGELIDLIKTFTDKPVALITNAALFYDDQVRKESAKADIVLPSLDGYNKKSWKSIDRPYGRLAFDTVLDGLIKFGQEYKGQHWIEIMLVHGQNDSDEALSAFSSIISNIKHNRLYVNTPVRPPAESFVEPTSHAVVAKFAEALGGTAIDALVSTGFASDIVDDFEALHSIILRHPMNKFEVENFLDTRNVSGKKKAIVFTQLNSDKTVTATEYKGIITYRAN